MTDGQTQLSHPHLVEVIIWRKQSRPSRAQSLHQSAAEWVFLKSKLYKQILLSVDQHFTVTDMNVQRGLGSPFVSKHTQFRVIVLPASTSVYTENTILSVPLPFLYYIFNQTAPHLPPQQWIFKKKNKKTPTVHQPASEAFCYQEPEANLSVSRHTYLHWKMTARRLCDK